MRLHNVSNVINLVYATHGKFRSTDGYHDFIIIIFYNSALSMKLFEVCPLICNQAYIFSDSTDLKDFSDFRLDFRKTLLEILMRLIKQLQSQCLAA